MTLSQMLSEGGIDASLLPAALAASAETCFQAAGRGDYSLLFSYLDTLKTHPATRILPKLGFLSREMIAYLEKLAAALEAPDTTDGGYLLVSRIGHIKDECDPGIISSERESRQSIREDDGESVILSLTLWRLIAEHFGEAELVARCDEMIKTFEKYTAENLDSLLSQLLSAHEEIDAYVSSFVLGIARLGARKDTAGMENLLGKARLFLHDETGKLRDFERLSRDL